MVNKVVLVGYLGRDAELRYTQTGQAVANFTMATSERWNDRDGQKQERTEWHRIVAWGKLGEFCGNYLVKGRLVYVEGKLQTREWEDKDGGKRKTTEVVAQTIQALGKRDQDSSGREEPERDGEYGPSGYPGDRDAGDDQIPF